jgi:hypothetical protein
MVDVFYDDIRRDPYPLYARLRSTTPLLRINPAIELKAERKCATLVRPNFSCDATLALLGNAMPPISE